MSPIGVRVTNWEGIVHQSSLPWSDDPDAVTVACPDAANPLVFELRRIREE